MVATTHLTVWIPNYDWNRSKQPVTFVVQNGENGKICHISRSNIWLTVGGKDFKFGFPCGVQRILVHISIGSGLVTKIKY